MGNGIEGIAPIASPSVPTIARPDNISKPQPPQQREDIRATHRPGDVPTRTRRGESDSARRRGRVTSIVANIDAGRVALMTNDSPPFRGYLDTDLQPGTYWLKSEKLSKKWVFNPGQVKGGLRFTVWLEGLDPFQLDYDTPLLLIVGNGVDSARWRELDNIVDQIRKLIENSTSQEHLSAIELLCQMEPIDLYDAVDALWTDNPGIVNALLLGMNKQFSGFDIDGLSGVVRALESFALPAKEIYIDAFDWWTVHPDSYRQDKEREKANLTNVQLALVFNLHPERVVVVYADDIGDSERIEQELPHYGPGNLTYPKALGKGTTPRIFEAKKAAFDQIETQNLEFLKTAFAAVADTLLSVYAESVTISRLFAKSQAAVVTEARSGPGKWHSSFEGGANMSAAAQRYELTSCGTPRGLGYYVGNVQFEGFKNGKLLDAKFWQSNGRVGAAILKQQPWAGWKALNQANRQLAVARLNGVGVEWRVADGKVADALRNLFSANKLSVSVVHIPP